MWVCVGYTSDTRCMEDNNRAHLLLYLGATRAHKSSFVQHRLDVYLVPVQISTWYILHEWLHVKWMH